MKKNKLTEKQKAVLWDFAALAFVGMLAGIGISTVLGLPIGCLYATLTGIWGTMLILSARKVKLN